MSARMSNALVIALLLATASAIALLNEKSNIQPSLTPQALTVRGKGITLTVPLTDIRQVTLVESPGYGAGGEEDGDLRWGTWTHDTWGQYQLLACKDIDACILITTSGPLYAFNFENLETTRSFYRSFLEYLAVNVP